MANYVLTNFHLCIYIHKVHIIYVIPFFIPCGDLPTGCVYALSPARSMKKHFLKGGDYHSEAPQRLSGLAPGMCCWPGMAMGGALFMGISLGYKGGYLSIYPNCMVFIVNMKYYEWCYQCWYLYIFTIILNIIIIWCLYEYNGKHIPMVPNDL